MKPLHPGGDAPRALRHFRGFNAAASLKLDEVIAISEDVVGNFRGFNAAASLKRQDSHRGFGAGHHFRGFNAAASLKQRPQCHTGDLLLLLPRF